MLAKCSLLDEKLKLLVLPLIELAGRAMPANDFK